MKSIAVDPLPMLEEPLHRMGIVLKGEDFGPRFRMRVPRQGDRFGTTTIVTGSAPPK